MDIWTNSEKTFETVLYKFFGCGNINILKLAELVRMSLRALTSNLVSNWPKEQGRSITQQKKSPDREHEELINPAAQ